VLNEDAWWWAVASIPLIAMLNVGVSFYLAFRVALRAHSMGRQDRAQIYRALSQRLMQRPFSFLVPGRDGT
jgi:site-specific recombinase